MHSNLLAALGLMLVIEGLLPLVAPQAWRETFKRMIALKDGTITLYWTAVNRWWNVGVIFKITNENAIDVRCLARLTV